MLNRPHIEFIQAQVLPWKRIGPGLARPDVEFKFLSRDPDDGACSILIRYPPRWHRAGPEHIEAAEEFYVLDGMIELNGDTFSHDVYGHVPAGTTRWSMSAPQGAVALTFLDREPVVHAGEGNTLPVTRVDALHTPWDMTLNDSRLAHLGISRKDLRLDPQNGERTFLSMVLPHSEPPGSKGPQEHHPVVEECYMINGQLTGPHGTMAPGAYFWRPPGIPHGPFGTRWGCVMLIRFVGGRHVNVWSEGDAPFDFNAPYKPVLPGDMAELAREPWHAPPIY